MVAHRGISEGTAASFLRFDRTHRPIAGLAPLRRGLTQLGLALAEGVSGAPHPLPLRAHIRRTRSIRVADGRRLTWGSPGHRSIPDRRQHLIPAGLQVFAQAPQRFVAGEGLDNVEGQAAAHSILGGGAAEAVQAHSLQAQQRAGLA